MQLRSPQTRLRRAPLSLALLIVVLLAAACAPSTSSGPLSTSAPSGAAPATNPTATSAAVRTTGDPSTVQTGVDADGNFYRGDPKAPVKLVEYSDFQ